MTPTILIEGPYRFYYFSNEPGRPHIHCGHDDDECKFWLERDGCPEISLKDPGTFSKRELKDIQKIIERHHITFLHRWYEYFGFSPPSYEGCS